LKKLFQVALGIVTSIGGFVEAGSIATAAQAGAEFKYGLLWAIALATLCIAVLVEMSGRLAAVSHHTLVGAVRERFGFSFQAWPLLAELLVDGLVLTSEIGGVCVALQLLTGWPARLFAIPAAVAVWIVLWKGTFGTIENGVALLGLLTVAFVVAAFRLHAPWTEVAGGLVPRRPSHDLAHYGFLAVSIVGATLSPYLMNFYASGAVEEKWTTGYIVINRWVAGLGMAFGSLIAMAVLVCAALVLHPEGIRVDTYDPVALLLVRPFPFGGYLLFCGALAIACFGAALEVGLNLAYVVSQSFGWNWSENAGAADDSRFSLVYTAALLLAAVLIAAGIDPLRLTMISMAFTVLILPMTVFPFLVLMNDRRYLGVHRNGWLGNSVVCAIIGLAFLLALVVIPLEILGGQ
jgi:Mn2+/Fe2+ NRAMP family transporter